MIDFSEYQRRARTTAVYPGQHTFTGLAYAALGLAGEAGEVSNKVKKILRDDRANLTPERRAAVLNEVGDVLWYCANLCAELRADLGEVAEENLDILADRFGRDMIRGDGDTR